MIILCKMHTDQLISQSFSLVFLLLFSVAVLLLIPLFFSYFYAVYLHENTNSMRTEYPFLCLLLCFQGLDTTVSDCEYVFKN